MNRGFTLIEVIVVAGLTALISATLAFLIVYFYRTNAYTLQESIAVAEARTSVEDAMRYIREASYGADGSYPIQSAAASSLTFFAAPNGSPNEVDKMTYLVLGGTLYRVETASAGNPPSYTGTVSTTTIAANIANDPGTPVFRYFDDRGNELPQPVNVTQIASIQTTVVIDIDINHAPTPFTLSGSATVRNLKEQL